VSDASVLRRSEVLVEETAAVAKLKSAASAAAKEYAARPTNSTLAAAKSNADALFALSDAALTQKRVDIACLLACFVGIFAFAIGITKAGKIMNLMGPAVVSGFQTAAAVTCVHALVASLCAARAAASNTLTRQPHACCAVSCAQHRVGSVQEHFRLRQRLHCFNAH
jgi:MFS superfamily sulfate permease-like transporter